MIPGVKVAGLGAAAVVLIYGTFQNLRSVRFEALLESLGALKNEVIEYASDAQEAKTPEEIFGGLSIIDSIGRESAAGIMAADALAKAVIESSLGVSLPEIREGDESIVKVVYTLVEDSGLDQALQVTLNAELNLPHLSFLVRHVFVSSQSDEPDTMLDNDSEFVYPVFTPVDKRMCLSQGQSGYRLNFASGLFLVQLREFAKLGDVARETPSEFLVMFDSKRFNPRNVEGNHASSGRSDYVCGSVLVGSSFYESLKYMREQVALERKLSDLQNLILTSALELVKRQPRKASTNEMQEFLKSAAPSVRRVRGKYDEVLNELKLAEKHLSIEDLILVMGYRETEDSAYESPIESVLYENLDSTQMRLSSLKILDSPRILCGGGPSTQDSHCTYGLADAIGALDAAANSRPPSISLVVYTHGAFRVRLFSQKCERE